MSEIIKIRQVHQVQEMSNFPADVQEAAAGFSGMQSQSRDDVAIQEGIMQIQPYLFFDGCGEEAVEFYRTVLDAEVTMLMYYKDSPDPPPPGMENKVMHASFRIGDSTVMASDDCVGKQTGFQGFSLSLTVANEADANRVFAALADGGQIRMPLAKTFWSPRFGMVADRFGVLWMVSVVS